MRTQAENKRIAGSHTVRDSTESLLQLTSCSKDSRVAASALSAVTLRVNATVVCSVQE